MSNSAGGSMLPIKDLESWTEHQCREQYWVRRKLLSEMVGTLYPAIVEGEMDAITERIRTQNWRLHP